MTEFSDTVSESHPAGWPEEQLLKECLVRRGRQGGPGGQHRNKVETAVEILHKPSGVSAVAAERRSPEANRRTAIRRLRVRLAMEIRHANSVEIHPSSLWNSRCRNQRIHCSERHADFPSLLAECLDAVDAKNYDVRRAAAALGCSTSQLVRFIGRVPDALQLVNDARVRRGQRPLKT